MKKIPLSNSDKVAIIDDEDFERVSRFTWRLGEHGYPIATVNGRRPNSILRMHNFLVEIDHENRDKLDNQKKNLRVATRSQNMANRPPYKNNKSGYRGVRKRGSFWRVNISKKGKQTFIGKFANILDAARAYDKAAREEYGKFAFTNFPMRFPR